MHNQILLPLFLYLKDPMAQYQHAEATFLGSYPINHMIPLYNLPN